MSGVVVARWNPLAITAFVLGLLGLGLLSVVFGHVALGQIRRTGESGAGLAVAGLVLGYLELVGAMVFIALVLLGLGTAAVFTGPR